VTLLGRDVGEIEALVTDRYLDSLLGGRAAPDGDERSPGKRRRRAPLDDAVRLVSQRLADDLPRFHPSFRFEERLALQLAEVAAAMRLPVAAGAEGGAPVPLRPHGSPDPLGVPLEDELDAFDEDGDGRAIVGRPILIGGAVAASAISLAGAWLAWRRNRSPASAFARAVRAAHAQRTEG